MANINVTWTPVTGSTDIDSYEVYVCDGTSAGHFADAAALQTKLDAIHGGATASSQGLDLIESVTDLAATSITTAHSITGTGSAVNYHFGIAAKNQGGFKVQDDTAVFMLPVT